MQDIKQPCNILSCNILLIGDTGAGKSSLLNYLCNEERAKTGNCSAHTEKGNFEPYDIVEANTHIRLFDTWGQETNKYDEWKKYIWDNINTLAASENVLPQQFFHSIIYCINASDARFDPDYNGKHLKEFISKGFNIIVAYTNSDCVSGPDCAKLAQVTKECLQGMIANNTMHGYSGYCYCVNICSVRKQKRNGKITEPFGKEDLINSIVKNFFFSLPYRVKSVLSDKIASWLKRNIPVYMAMSLVPLPNQEKRLFEKINVEVRDFEKEIYESLMNSISEELKKIGEINCIFPFLDTFGNNILSKRVSIIHAYSHACSTVILNLFINWLDIISVFTDIPLQILTQAKRFLANSNMIGEHLYNHANHFCMDLEVSLNKVIKE